MNKTAIKVIVGFIFLWIWSLIMETDEETGNVIFYIAIVIIIIDCIINNYNYKELETKVFNKIGFKDWNLAPIFEDTVTLSNLKVFSSYDEIYYFKSGEDSVESIETILKSRNDLVKTINDFLEDNEFKDDPKYPKIVKKMNYVLNNAKNYHVKVVLLNKEGKNSQLKLLSINQNIINKIKDNPSLIMSKSEYNRYLKDIQKQEVENKQHSFYDRVNNIIDFANNNRENLLIKGSKQALDTLIAQLFDRTVNSIKKVKSVDSDEWDTIDNFIDNISSQINKLVEDNQEILNYYESDNFTQLKDTCETLMSTQREFNEYVNEKVKSISNLFGIRVLRTETSNEDVNNYIRPYKKEITPFTAEVSSAVFASAENNPLEYIVKYFYPYKSQYPEQIQKLSFLIEELETLKDAKVIIENYKKDYQEYLVNVPNYVLENDEAGFYSRLGFANIDEDSLTVEYKFSYTSDGGFAHRSFTVPMTEETIVELIDLLESKLTMETFTKEQRSLMTKKLRDKIKERDNYTCCNCGNSVHNEPNLLLEIDHIIPVSKGGCTEEDNLQTLCWKCNRAKGSKIEENI